MNDFDEIENLFYALALALSFLFIFLAMKNNAPSPSVVLPPPQGPAPPPQAPAPVPRSDSNVLQQLIDAGATFYGASWCGFTKKQLAELNITEAEPRGLDYVDCENQEELCVSKGIDAFPTWQINGELFPGYYPPAKLAELLTKKA
jgi:hypothetical protein